MRSISPPSIALVNFMAVLDGHGRSLTREQLLKHGSHVANGVKSLLRQDPLVWWSPMQRVIGGLLQAFGHVQRATDESATVRIFNHLASRWGVMS
jgi:hypothetical protein